MLRRVIWILYCSYWTFIQSATVVISLLNVIIVDPLKNTVQFWTQTIISRLELFHFQLTGTNHKQQRYDSSFTASLIASLIPSVTASLTASLTVSPKTSGSSPILPEPSTAF